MVKSLECYGSEFGFHSVDKREQQKNFEQGCVNICILEKLLCGSR